MTKKRWRLRHRTSPRSGALNPSRSTHAHRADYMHDTDAALRASTISLAQAIVDEAEATGWTAPADIVIVAEARSEPRLLDEDQDAEATLREVRDALSDAPRAERPHQ